MSGQLTTLGLDRATNRLEIIQGSKLFLRYKVMTIFITHDYHFTTLWTLLLSIVHGNTTKLVWRLLLLNHSLKSSRIVSSGCYMYNIVLAWDWGLITLTPRYEVKEGDSAINWTQIKIYFKYKKYMKNMCVWILHFSLCFRKKGPHDSFETFNKEKKILTREWIMCTSHDLK